MVRPAGLRDVRRRAAELFPTRRRTTGISIAYVLAQLVFGGVTPRVVAALIGATGNRAAPGLYLAGVTLLSLGCLWGCRRVKAEPFGAATIAHGAGGQSAKI